MKVLTEFLKNNTEVRETYVAVGTAVVNALATPLEMLLSHLLEVQGIDPKEATPNQFLKEALVKALEQVDDPEELDPNFDVDWVLKHYAKAKGRLDNLTREAYRKMTDLTHVPDKQTKEEEKLSDAMRAAKTWTPKDLYTVQDQETFQKMAEKKVNEEPVTEPSSLKEALDVLSKYAHLLESESGEEKPTVSVPRAPVSVGRSRKAKKKASAKLYSDVHPESKVARHRVTKTFKNGNFRRVAEDK